jgi:hypothetical protein
MTRTRRRLTRIFLIVLAGLAIAEPARAQSRTPLVEVSAGVAVISNRCDSVPAATVECPGAPKTFLDTGVVLTIGRTLSDRFALVGEIARHDITYDVDAGRPQSARSFMVGAKLAKDRGHVRVFGQLLVGAASSDAYPGGFAIQPGVGVDFGRTHRMGIRLAIDDWIVPQDGGHLSGVRLPVGFTARLGSR